MSNIFSRRYHGKWLRSSGHGSTLEATADLQELIPQLVAELDVQSVLDAACGDGLWMPDLPAYIGMDIAPEAVERSRERHPDRFYLVHDLRDGELPGRELVICRDVIIHLPLLQGVRVLDNIKRSGATWLLTTTFPKGKNISIEEGRFFRPDLTQWPFSLGQPERLIEDTSPGKYLGLWRLR